MAGFQGGKWSSCCQISGFPGGSLVAQVPSLTWRVPTPSLEPEGLLHHLISGPLPPWGSGPSGRRASYWPKLRETRRPLCPVLPTAKIPLIFLP